MYIIRYNKPLSRAPLDYERHQVQALCGRASTAHLAATQEFCDAYGLPEGDPVDPAPISGRREPAAP